LETESELHVLTTTALDQRPVLVVQKEDPLQVRTQRHPGVSAVGRRLVVVSAACVQYSTAGSATREKRRGDIPSARQIPKTPMKAIMAGYPVHRDGAALGELSA